MRVVLVFVGLLAAASALTAAQRNQILLNVMDPVLRSPPTNIEVQPGDFRGALIRLVFHECGTWDPSFSGTNRGGCHACVHVTSCTTCDFTAGNNKGLEDSVQFMNNLYQTASVNGTALRNIISLADFSVLFSKRAVEAAAGVPLNLPYKWGRTDCALTSPQFSSRLPAASIADPFPQFVNVFENKLGLTTRQWVALMGSHSVGRMENKNSGFNGPWESVEPNLMNNRYFRELTSNDWERITQTNGNRLWHIPTNNDGSLGNNQLPRMLDPDVGIFWRISGGCQITRSQGSCPEEPRIAPKANGATLPSIVRSFAANNTVFLNDYAAAWGVLTNLGGDTLFDVTSCGNGRCEANGGETRTTCSADC